MVGPIANPTSHIGKSQFWGFEVVHILGSFLLMFVVNIGLSAFGLPVFLSWIAGLLALGVLRLISHGQKAGHLVFLLQWMTDPHLYLGTRFLKKGAKDERT